MVRSECEPMAQAAGVKGVTLVALMLTASGLLI